MMIIDFFRKKINSNKIETVISHFDNHLWNVGIQKDVHFCIGCLVYQKT